MEFRKATRVDINKFTDNRIEFVTSIRSIDNIEDFCFRTKKYLEEHIDKDNLVIYIALDNTEIISSCMACVFEVVPFPSCPTGKVAELLNVYTKPEYRRKGFSEKLVTMLLHELKEKDVQNVILEYTDDGLCLYQKLGFTEINHQMQLRL